MSRTRMLVSSRARVFVFLCLSALTLLVFHSPVSGNTVKVLCDPASGVGAWEIVDWVEYSATGNPAWDFYYGRQHAATAEETVGGTSTRLYGYVYCDRFTGPLVTGKTPWSYETVPSGTPAISPLPQRAAPNACWICWDPYNPVDPFCYHPGVTDGVVLMRTKEVRKYFCQCVDNDGDGHYAVSPSCPPGDDTKDNDPTFPGPRELCDNKDNNGNGLVDEGCWCNTCLNQPN